MRILLTGGTGFIGSNTAVALLEAGHEVVIIDNYSNSSPDVLAKIKEVTGKDVCCDNSDVTDIQSVRRLFAGNKFDGVIHFAAFKAVGESVASKN
jgi:UDP-glucose 4-epimerase